MLKGANACVSDTNVPKGFKHKSTATIYKCEDNIKTNTKELVHDDAGLI